MGGDVAWTCVHVHCRACVLRLRVGEYSDRIDNATELLESFLDAFLDVRVCVYVYM